MPDMPLTVTGVAIRRDEAGRFCLNDLHRAAGGEDRHKPANWLRRQETIDLAFEIAISDSNSIAHIRAIESKQGLGTYVVRELVYDYAMWISPAFHLRVIRAYDAMVSKPQFAVPQSLPEALRLAAEAIEAKEHAEARVLELQPKAEFYDAVAASNSDRPIGLVAKELGTGEIRFFRWLREVGILQKNNIPYQPYVDAGYLRVVERTWRDSNKEPRSTPQTLVTSKGLPWLQRKWGQAA